MRCGLNILLFVFFLLGINSFGQKPIFIYYDNKKLKNEIIFISKKKVMIKEYSVTGKISSIMSGKFINDSIPKITDGKVTFYNEKGITIRKGVIKNGNYHRRLTTYLTNGTKAYYTYNNGVFNGPCLLRYENGKIKCRGSYKNNKKIGTWEEFYSNGVLKSKGRYSGKEKVIEYSQQVEDSLKKISQVEPIVFPYILSYKEGEWVYYDENGKLIATEWYNSDGNITKNKPNYIEK